VKHEVASAHDMQLLGSALAHSLEDGALIFLEGDLGTGKTTLVRGFLRGLGHQGPVRSPTYTLIEPYELRGRLIYHIDLYRLSDPEELEYLGARDFLTADAVYLVEWPDRAASALPRPDLRIRLAYTPAGRTVEFSPESVRGRRLLRAIALEM
jgi:tRNA threonylcarbamoyladenosine biosynthesis protein TsaE